MSEKNIVVEEAEEETFANVEDATLFIEEEEKPSEAANELEAAFKLPEKFEGKSAEEVAKSYIELETVYGKQATEYGDLRKLTDKMLFERMDPNKVQDRKDTDEQPQREAITFDDLVEDPDTAVDKLVSSKLKVLDDKLDQFEKKERLTEFKAKFQNFDNDLADEDFQTWVQGSTYRSNLFRKADQYDTDAATELWTEWGEVKTRRSAEMQEARDDKENKSERSLKKASSESGSTGARTRQVFRRVDLINLKATNPDKYYENIEVYKAAYKEGRVK